MALIERLMTVQIALANGVFAGGGNSITLKGLRMSCRITIPGGATMSQLEGVIYGVPLSVMNQLSTVGKQLDRQAKNTIVVMAGDAQSGQSLVYSGTLFSAYVDAQNMPQVGFRVSGMEGHYEAIKPVAPTSVEGSGDVSTIMQGLAGQMGLTFENSGVKVKINNPYLSGSARMQVLTLAKHAGIEHVINCGKLAIWMPGQPRQGTSSMFSAATGMVGYPAFNQASVIVKKVFDPTAVLGGQIQVQSDLTPACGAWLSKNVTHDLEVLVPHGRWFTTIEATPIVGATDP